jgi:DNA repair protein RecO (recombination protein O)
LREDNLLSGLYLNELLIRLLPRFDPHPALFVGYGEAIEALQSDSGEIALRRFELILLTELGYRIDWWSDTNQDPIAESGQYFFDPAQGFSPALPSSAAELTQKRISGAVLLAVGNYLKGGALPQRQALLMMKEVTRVAISQLTQGRTLNSRDIFRSLKRGPAPRDD